MLQRARVIVVLALALSSCDQAALAAHPLETEDSSTQGQGNLEIENGLTKTRLADGRVWAYQPQISFGISSVFDLIVQPSWLQSRDGFETTRGLGDTNVDMKWRFYGSDPWALAVRAGLSLATSQRQLGMRHGDVAAHALLVGSYDAAPLVLHANLGVARSPYAPGQRSTSRRASGAVMWSVDERLVLTVDAGTESNDDASQRIWPATVLAGAVYTIVPGLDVDVGYQQCIRGRGPTRKWLLGLTYRFAP